MKGSTDPTTMEKNEVSNNDLQGSMNMMMYIMSLLVIAFIVLSVFVGVQFRGARVQLATLEDFASDARANSLDSATCVIETAGTPFWRGG